MIHLDGDLYLDADDMQFTIKRKRATHGAAHFRTYPMRSPPLQHQRRIE